MGVARVRERGQGEGSGRNIIPFQGQGNVTQFCITSGKFLILPLGGGGGQGV